MLLFDTRWEDAHGIGRMAAEIRRRVFASRQWSAPVSPSSPVSPLDPLVRGVELALYRDRLFYSPGFNPPLFGRSRSVFTIHDLIHIRVDDESSKLKRIYYEALVKPAIASCFRVLTVSEYSKRDILEWSGADERCVINVGDGVGSTFFERVKHWQPGYPYFLYIGARKPHKNLDRLLEAYAQSYAAKSIRLVLSGKPEKALVARAGRLGIADCVVFAGRIPDVQLPAYYQGARALLFPSYFEGFGLPPVEAMAGGTPALTSNVTSLPEVVGDAALIIDPFSVDALRDGIDRIAGDETLRARLISAGPTQARKHSWDTVASKVSTVLDELIASTTR